MSRYYWILGSAVGLIAAAWTVSAQPTLPGAPPPDLPPLPGMMALPPPGLPSFPPPLGWAPAEGTARPPFPPVPPGFAEACLDRLAHRAAARAYLKARLDLTPQQLPIWQELDAVAIDVDAAERQACAKLPHRSADQAVLQRLDAAEERAARQLADLRKVSEPLRRLTATLSPGQQKLIDQSMPPFPF